MMMISPSANSGAMLCPSTRSAKASPPPHAPAPGSTAMALCTGTLIQSTSLKICGAGTPAARSSASSVATKSRGPAR